MFPSSWPEPFDSLRSLRALDSSEGRRPRASPRPADESSGRGTKGEGCPMFGLLGTFLALFALAQTPSASCVAGRVTPPVTEGPFYKTGSPQRTSLLEPGMAGTKLTITGQVFTRGCRPVAGAWLDFWQADAQGKYDNAGYRLRGHQVTDGAGRYTLLTVMPGEYPGRTPHIHVKVRAPNGPVLTTQLYFPGAAGNQSDSLFRQELLLQIRDTTTGKAATFNFTVDSE